MLGKVLPWIGDQTKSLLSLLGLYEFAAYFAFRRICGRKGIALRKVHTEAGSLIEVRKAHKIIRCNWRHVSYLLDIASSFDSYFGAVEPVGVGAELIVDYSQPRFHIMLPSREELFITGLAESEEISRLYVQETDLKCGEIVLDVGAYCGGSSIFFSRIVGDLGEVHSYEPDEENFKALALNVEKTRSANIKIYKEGMWTHPGEVEFQMEGNMGSSMASILARRSSRRIVRVVTLRDAIDRCRGASVQVIKLDIEGAELAVLQSSREVLGSTAPRLILEPHRVHGRENTRDICNALDAYGFDWKILPQADMYLPLIAARPKRAK